MPKVKFSRRETIVISVLMFSSTEGVENLISQLPEKLDAALVALNLQASIVIRKNNPILDSGQLKEKISNLNVIYDRMSFALIDGGQNFGFGRGHNLNYLTLPSQYFLVLNDDIEFTDVEWLKTAILRMRVEERLALIGDTGNPSAINPIFTNGVFPDAQHTYSLRYAEASILVARSAAFQEIGMFDETITWAMGEDSDLSFKAQQLGYVVDWIPIRHRHFRSTSFNSLPSYQKSAIIEHNRSRLFAKWGDALHTGRIGKYDIFDIFSDGLGDMFCALLHLRQLFEESNELARQHIVVNCSDTTLADLLLPDAVYVTSERDLNSLRNQYGQDGINSVRSIRPVNYALPFNIHDLLSGVLSLPSASRSTIASIANDLKSGLPKQLEALNYCVLHLEFERKEHHGRAPSDLIKKNISKLVSKNFKVVVVIGKTQSVDVSYLDHPKVKVIDLQGSQNLSEMISTVANADHFVGIDSFPFHIAQAVGIPCVTFFGSVNPILRALNQDLIWPIVAEIDCLGCYHDQIERGAPFCMRMNDECTTNIPASLIATSIVNSKNRQPYNWDRLRRLLSNKQRNIIHFLNFHPSPQAQIFNSPISSGEISEMIYDLTNKIAGLTKNHAKDAYIPQLQEENRRIRSELLEANTQLASYELSPVAPVSTTDPLFSISADAAMLSAEECVLAKDGELLTCEAFTNDPRLIFGPFLVFGRRFGVVIVSCSYPTSQLVLYWRKSDEAFDESQKMVIEHSDQFTSRVWWYGGEPSGEMYIRIDPSDRIATVSLKVKFVGDIRLSEDEPR